MSRRDFKIINKVNKKNATRNHGYILRYSQDKLRCRDCKHKIHYFYTSRYDQIHHNAWLPIPPVFCKHCIKKYICADWKRLGKPAD